MEILRKSLSLDTFTGFLYLAFHLSEGGSRGTGLWLYQPAAHMQALPDQGATSGNRNQTSQDNSSQNMYRWNMKHQEVKSSIFYI